MKQEVPDTYQRSANLLGTLTHLLGGTLVIQDSHVREFLKSHPGIQLKIDPPDIAQGSWVIRLERP